MGRGIAGVCALAGHDTRVFDADPDAQRAVRGHVEGSWARAVDKGKLTAEAVESARHRLRIIERLKDATEVDFADRGRARGDRAQTDALLGARRPLPAADDLRLQHLLALDHPDRAATGRRDRVIGIHFFNPVAAMPLVEIVRGKDTSAETEGRALELVRSLGKEAVRVHDSPGFATSRLGVALGLEAMRMVEEGVATRARHRPGARARLRPPDGAAQDDRPRRPRRPPRDRRDPRRRASVGPLRAARRSCGRSFRKDGPAKIREGFYTWNGDKAVGGLAASRRARVGSRRPKKRSDPERSPTRAPRAEPST